MFFKDAKALFIHIPKTAGSTVSVRIGPKFYGKSVVDYEKNKNSFFLIKGSWTQHFSYKEHEELLGDLSDFFSFTFVRNPYDRALSEYFYVKNNGCVCKKPQDFTFEEFLEQKMPCAFGRHKLTQKSFLLNKHGEVAVKQIFRFENFESDFNDLCKLLNIKDVKKISRLQSQRKTPYQAYYNNTTKELVENIFKEDIDYLGYSFKSPILI